jgi:hypothetical protein
LGYFVIFRNNLNGNNTGMVNTGIRTLLDWYMTLGNTNLVPFPPPHPIYNVDIFYGYTEYTSITPISISCA